MSGNRDLGCFWGSSVQTAIHAPSHQSPSKGSILYDPNVRGIAYQVILVIVVGYVFYEAASNAVENLQRAKIASGFGFLNNAAGFDISQSLIQFSAAGSTYGDAFIVGLLNTLIVSAIGIFFTTILGFLIGIARLSKNWMVAKVAMVYVEVLRNIPLLVQLLFWYIAVLGTLPQPRNSLEMGAGFYLNSRGLFMAKPIYGPNISVLVAALAIGLVGTFLYRRWAKKQQEQTG